MAGLATPGCLEETTVAAFVAGALGPSELQGVEAHLDQCADCMLVVAAVSSDSEAPSPLAFSASKGDSRFERVEFVAEGATARVYRALDRETGAVVAVKQLKRSLGPANEEALARFVRESEILRQLDHPNIVKILASRHHGDEHEIVMEYVPGGSLRALLRAERCLAPERAVTVMLELADALARAHHLGVIHRDIKPENILLASDGTPRLSDFGLARFEDQQLTGSGRFVGTLPYLSPEALNGFPLDGRADIWALGVVLFEMLAGFRPFRGEPPGSVVSAILQQPIPDLAKVCPGVPSALADLAQWMLTRDPQRRISSARHLGALLEGIRKGDPALPERSERSSSTPRRRSPTQVAPMVGRERALANLRALFDRACDGQRQTVFVTGEAGIGKTTLVNALLSSLRETTTCRIARGQCIRQSGAGEAYLPILEAVGRLCRESGGGLELELLRRTAPTWLQQLDPRDAHGHRTPSARLPPVAVPQRMLREMAEFAEALAREQPLVLLLEDIHWADYSTLDLVSYLSRRFDAGPLLLIATLRPSEASSVEHPIRAIQRDLRTQDFCHELSLDHLDQTAVGDYLAQRFPEGRFPKALVSLLHRRTSGNPLFLCAVTNLWNEPGWGGFRPDGAAVDLRELARVVPESLRDLIGSESERLSPFEQGVLRAASVAGMAFSTAAVAAGIGEDIVRVEEIFAQWAQRRQFVRAIGASDWPDQTPALTYEFLHELYQQVIYEAIPPTLRTSLHLRIGNRKELAYGENAHSIAGDLAVHFEQSREPLRAIHYLRVVGNQAVSRSGCREAADYFSRALQLVANVQDAPARSRLEMDLQIALGGPLAMTKGFSCPDVHGVYDRALELCSQVGDASDLLPIKAAIRNFRLTSGDHDGAQLLGQELLSLGAAGNQRAAVEGSMTMALCSLFFGQLEDADSHARQTILLYDECPPVSPGLFSADPRVMAGRFGALTTWIRGYPDLALRRAQATLTFSRTREAFDVAGAWTMVARLWHLRGELELACEENERVSRFCAQHGFALWRAISTIEWGAALFDRGDRAKGLDLIARGLKSYRSVGAYIGATYFLSLAAQNYIKAGYLEEAFDLIEDGFATMRRQREVFWQSELLRLAGELLLALPGDARLAELTTRFGIPSSAEGCFLRALQASRKIKAKSLELRAAARLAQLLVVAGRQLEAWHVMSETWASFEEGHDTPMLATAKLILDDLAASRDSIRASIQCHQS